MKRVICILLLACLFLSGCSIFTERIKEPVTFYYLKSDYEFFSQEGVFASEEREASGHRDDITYLLALYLMGPSEDGLEAPLPKGTSVLRVEKTEELLTIKLSEHTKSMTDIDYSLACACLALSCLDLTEAETITINSGERSVTMSRDTLSLYDGSAAAEDTK